MVAERLRVELGQPVIIDNRPGATGTIGTAAALRAPADGYTLLFTTSTNQIIAPLLLEKPPYDGAKDFTPITPLIRYLGVLIVNSEVPVKSVAELVAYVKQRPGKLNYASSGIGSTNHLLGEMLKARTGMELVHVPYKGSAPAVQALAAGEVQVFFDTVPSAQNWMRQGKVRVLATGADKRSSLMPEVPTLVELGIFDGTTDYWMGLMAPPDIPSPLVSRIHDAVKKVMTSPEMSQFAAQGGGEIAVGNPVIWFDPNMAEDKVRPYAIKPRGDFILVFPVSPTLVIFGSPKHKKVFSREGLRYSTAPDEAWVARTNQAVAKFAYETVFAQRPGEEEVIRMYASKSPVWDPSGKGNQMVFGRRVPLQKWSPGS